MRHCSLIRMFICACALQGSPRMRCLGWLSAFVCAEGRVRALDLDGRLRLVGPNATVVHPGMLPEFASHLKRVGTRCLPPSALIAGTMNRAVMNSTQRNREFIAGFAAEGPRLRIAEMVRVRWFAAADEAGLLGDETKVFAVAVTARSSNREDALVDAGGSTGSVCVGRTGQLNGGGLPELGLFDGDRHSSNLIGGR